MSWDNAASNNQSQVLILLLLFINIPSHCVAYLNKSVLIELQHKVQNRNKKIGESEAQLQKGKGIGREEFSIPEDRQIGQTTSDSQSSRSQVKRYQRSLRRSDDEKDKHYHVTAQSDGESEQVRELDQEHSVD